ncbi:hypothetical protein N1851_023912 [Merluccius polli]|uniref:APC membrane recruitment protein 2 n=1 Tax=Merluccius polli TaxID=89951 RepID=A0AA47MFJ5_MERPO|nr:hypothetical protein N1851_023912 [Merluccius polli]
MENNADNAGPQGPEPNGYVNRVFSVSLDVHNETSTVCIQEMAPPGPAEPPPPEDQASQDSLPKTPGKPAVHRRDRRAAGGIWKILTRKRVASDLERRPHSMILPGEASVPKLSFADKVRTFKKLKSPSVFRGKTGKLSGGKFGSSLVDEDSFCHDFGTPGQPVRATLKHRAKRHSYAGYTTEYECSFEDLDLAAAPSENHQPANPAEDAAPTQNGCKPAERVCYAKRTASGSANCNNVAAATAAAGCEEPSVVRGSPRGHPAGARRSRGPDVWNYLRRISLLGKGNPVYSERSFDSDLPTLDKTMDSDYGSVDFESVRDFQPAPPKHPDNKGHFGGLLKFFNSFAESARKWRSSTATTTRSFSPPEGEKTPLGSPRPAQRPVETTHGLQSSARPSPTTPKPSQSSTLERRARAAAGDGRSPTVVLRAFRACPNPPAANGIHCGSSQGAEQPTHRLAAQTALATIENHAAWPGPTRDPENVSVYGAGGAPSGRPCPEGKEEGQSSGNERDSTEAPPDSRQTQELTGQSQAGDEGSIANSVPPSDSTEEIFKLCEQIAVGQSGSGIDRSSPVQPTHCSAGKARARPKPAPHARPRPRPASALLDLWRPLPAERDLYPGYAEVGSLCRRRRRPAAFPAGQRMGTAGRSRPHSVIETTVAMEMQATELHRIALSRPLGVSPLEPPLRVSLQRCRSLPLAPSTLSTLALLRHQEVGEGQSSSSVRLRGGVTGSCRRRLLRPGSERLQVNIVSNCQPKTKRQEAHCGCGDCCSLRSVLKGLLCSAEVMLLAAASSCVQQSQRYRDSLKAWRSGEMAFISVFVPKVP